MDDQGNVIDVEDKFVLTKPKDVTIFLGKGDYVNNFKTATIDGSTANFTLNKEYGPYKNKTGLTLSQDNFDIGETKDIRISSEGYKDKTFSIKVLNDGESLPLPTYIGIYKDYNSTVNEMDVEFGNNTDLVVSSYSDNKYKENILGMRIVSNGEAKRYQKDSLKIMSNKLTISKEWLSLGENIITLKTNGYNDYVATINVIDTDVPSSITLLNTEGNPIKDK